MCNSANYVASIDEGCVDLKAIGATNYKLRSLTANPGRMTRTRSRTIPLLSPQQTVPEVATPWWVSLQEEARQKLNVAPDEAVGSLSPIWDPTLPATLGHGHGDVTERFGQTWKWQQVALGMTIGIPIDEWDDEVHVKSDRFIVYGSDDYDTLVEGRDSDDYSPSTAKIKI